MSLRKNIIRFNYFKLISGTNLYTSCMVFNYLNIPHYHNSRRIQRWQKRLRRVYHRIVVVVFRVKMEIQNEIYVNGEGKFSIIQAGRSYILILMLVRNAIMWRKSIWGGWFGYIMLSSKLLDSLLVYYKISIVNIEINFRF